jgi:hypothetical protein
MTIKIWISSFIPKNIAGYTKPVPGGGGQTMIPGPLPISDCFLTDQRGFTANASASSRTHSFVEVNATTLSLIGENHNCDNTVEVDCGDGDTECDKKSDSSGLSIANFSNSGISASFTFKGGAGNPCALGAPHIDWLVHVKVTKSVSDIAISVESGSLVEPFPSFEMYASYAGATEKIFNRAPNPGATPWNLIGDPDEPISGSVNFSL